MYETSLGPAQHHENLTIFPVLAEKERELSCLLMAEALALGILTISEKDGGEVPLLLATNAGREEVLILDGEQLIGAKQNRMTNRSILLPPETITEIPVSCMEQGRWDSVGYDFSPAPQHAPSKVRRKAREAERQASYRAEHRGPGARSSYRDLASAQGTVWEEIRQFEGKLGKASDTGALNALYENRRGKMESWMEAFPLAGCQTGLMAFQGRAPLALDAVGSAALYAKAHRRLLTGYILDAMGEWDPDQTWPEPTPGDARRWFQTLQKAERIPSDSVGAGEYRILRGNVLGGELVNEDRMIHVSAFPSQNQARRTKGSGEADPVGSPIARPSRRRKNF